MTQAEQIRNILGWLERKGTKRGREAIARYGIVAPKLFGVSLADIQSLAKRLGKDHDLAVALWQTGWYEARLLAAFVGEPERLTPATMDRWVRDFDNWGVCDTLCFKLFDASPHAWKKVEQWSRRREEFVKRAAFALIASLALHDGRSGDAPFMKSLRLIERESGDERNFVKKGVSWALRGIGHRNAPLHAAALAVAQRLAESSNPAARWVGKDALKDITRPLVLRRIAARRTRDK